MILLEKLREAAVSVVPVMLLVWLLHLTIAPLEDDFGKFVIGGCLLVAGLGIFLLGAEVGIVPMGRRAGAALTGKRNLSLLLGAGFAIGFFITVAEPDVHVLGAQVASVAAGINSFTLVLCIAVGVGLFVSLSLLRVIFRISFRMLLFIAYGVVFLCAVLGDPAFVGIAFDAGGATTGPMTVPFILALGVGVASVRAGGSNGDSFGLIGIASVGPILSVLLMGFFRNGSGEAPATAALEHGASIWGHFLHYIPETSVEVGMALAPLVGLFAVFRLFLLRNMTFYRMIRVIAGLVYTYLGLVCFFVGVKGGFIPAGASLGAIMANHELQWLLPIMAFVLGALVVFAEPAVWVLTSQVEDVSGGAINGKLLLGFLCAGVACAVALAVIRSSMGLSLWAFLLPGYGCAFLLTFFCPPLFTAIAFDSGGVASGPMASTFILAFTLGAANASGAGAGASAFGAIALIAMTPLIAIQLLGIIYARKISAMEKK